MPIEPYLFFEGRCEEAAEFYRGAVGAQVLMMMRYKDSPEPHEGGSRPMPPPDKVMHMRLRVGNGIILASDGHCSGKPNFHGFALSLTVANAAEAEQKFNALAAGGNVMMPMTKTFFSPAFGMVTDRFGVTWMVYVAAPGS